VFRRNRREITTFTWPGSTVILGPPRSTVILGPPRSTVILGPPRSTVIPA